MLALQTDQRSCVRSQTEQCTEEKTRSDVWQVRQVDTRRAPDSRGGGGGGCRRWVPGPEFDSVEAHGQAIEDDQLPAGCLTHPCHDLDGFQGLQGAYYARDDA